MTSIASAPTRPRLPVAAPAARPAGRRRSAAGRAATAVLAAVLATAVATGAAGDPVLWPEDQRSFLQDGPALLLPRAEREALLALGEAERAAAIAAFLARDPLPETPLNELSAAIARRRHLVGTEGLSPLDVRGRLLFLHGAPAARFTVDCGNTFRPLEIWTYPEGGARRALVLYRPGPALAWRLWLPIDSKRVLYGEEMEYWLEQFEELKGRIRARRFDLQTCPDTPKVDEATGIDGLFGFRRDRPTQQQLAAYLEPPADLAAWARQAAATPPPAAAAELPGADLAVLFPEWQGQRIVTRFLLSLPADAGLEPFLEKDQPAELRLAIDGMIEAEEAVFDTFRILFKLPPPAAGVPLALAFDRPLRSGRSFLARLRLRDEVGGGERFFTRGFAVPAAPQPVAEPPLPETAIVALGEELAGRRLEGADSLTLVPPDRDVVLGLWRAEALVTGSRIERVVFLLDGEQQLARGQRPFSVEMRLATYPTEQVVRAEGYDAEGRLVAADEVVLNQPTGSLRVRIVEPRRGAAAEGRVAVRAEVVVPEDHRVERVEVAVNDRLAASLDRPPWAAEVSLPAGEEIVYLTVAALLEDGTRAEDVRFLRAPEYLEEVEVDLVELYTTVTDGSGQPVQGLPREDFAIFEDGRPQQVSEFDAVTDLPLTVGIVIDTSGSMATSLPEAQKAGKEFLENIITPHDRFFLMGFATRPRLLLAPTDDVAAAALQLEGLRSEGWTALHDAVVTSLYYFRGVRGRRAMVLLSDGDDTASGLAWRETLEYARRSGVAVYAVGLHVGKLAIAVRRKLSELAEETGGRVFYIERAEELDGVYDEIEAELRSQYLLAYSPEGGGGDGAFRTVEVKVRGGRLKARTIRGYYP